MDQIKPELFLLNFNERLDVTTTTFTRYNSYYERLISEKKETDETVEDATDDYGDRVFYFKYYLDFASAIEAMTKQILFLQYHDKEFVNKKICYQKDNFAALFPPDEIVMIIKALFGDDGFTEYTYGDLYDFIKNELKIIRISNRKTRSKTEKISLTDFIDAYGNIEKYRHKVAHSMPLKNVNYSETVLMDFCLSFYLIYKFYKKYYFEISNE